MARPIFLLFLALFFLQCSPGGKEESTQSAPNILLIMSDDHAFQALSAYSDRLMQTPHIDRIGTAGAVFPHAFVTNSICAPSRAVILTGKYSHLNGLRDNRDVFDGSQMTFPKLLQQGGYYTAIVGKWHLKTAPTGFDYWNVLIGQGHYYNPDMVNNGDTIRYTGYTTDVITDLTLQVLEDRDPDKPFAMLYWHKAPHRNWMPDTSDFDLFADDLPLPETFYDDYRTRSAAAREQDMRIEDMYMTLDMKLLPEDVGGEDPGTGGNRRHRPEQDWLNNLDRLTPGQRAAWDAHYDSVRLDFRQRNLSGRALAEWKYQRYIKDYLRSVHSVDRNIGRVLDYLDEQGLAENTLVIYTSDQGFYLGEHGWYDKRFMYEESLRTPLLIRYPARVPGGQRPDPLVLNLDLAPTILDFAGLPVPDPMQGRSLRPILTAQTPADWRKAIYYHYYEYPHGWHDVKKHDGVRTARYKLIHFYDDIDAWELFDLQADPREVNNLFENPDYAPVVDSLKKTYYELREQYEVPEDDVILN